MMAAVEAKGDITTIRMDGRRGKIKYAAPFDPIHLQMKTVELPQLDAYGRNLSTLVCTDGSKAKRLSEAISSDTTATAAILEILNNSDDPMSRDELRELYAKLPAYQGKKKDSIGRTFRRAIKQLFEDELIIEENEKISTT
jgi:ADP-ribosylglycohydrolase